MLTDSSRFTDHDAYIFVPETPYPSLVIHRSTGDIVLNEGKTEIPMTAKRARNPIYGIFGIISLTLSEYVIVITAREPKGTILGNAVYRATQFELLPLNPAVNLSSPLHPVESHLLGLVRSHLDSGSFWLSYTGDLSTRLQVQWEQAVEREKLRLWEKADDRFFWNRFLQTRLIESSKHDLSPFILPVIYGTFDARPATLHGRHMALILISRRSRFRAGTRYFRRGLDHEGNVANFNETEQILISSLGLRDGSIKMSFVQIRGSVPVFWGEVNTLRYKPDLQLMDLPETPDIMRRHFQDITSRYGPDTVLVNLVNHKGHEMPVKDAYEKNVAIVDNPKINYQYFDFHNECKHMRWDRISVLIDRTKQDLERHGYVHISPDSATPKLQQGVVRTNCLDNLDRTNVVQAALAKWTLNRQLMDLGIISKESNVDDFEMLSKDFREMWADHGDAISRAYAGSAALKSDFTRINKRTRKGLLEDGVKSAVRYLKNNFFDGARQDAFDLITGAYVPRKNPASVVFLVSDTRDLLTRSMPFVTSFSLFMICAGMTLPRSSDYSLVYYFLLWFVFLVTSMAYIVLHGISYVSWPRLIPLNDLIYYTGPGYRSGRHGKGFKTSKAAPLVANRWDKPQKASWFSKVGQADGHEVEMGLLSTFNKKRVD
ncbi:hypothetical protein FISHEDRAFT_64308 [Fistulina hepatica ATCC 64428]|uniref:SAC domain-containing protein n=1 Tax=Fistulina hepatica ATCC 64428 TaxID=1128425 RepID=A0A0D7AHT9_9AGAR|nr:hypothetical protein FISHEDRAFT_64308 [Fistulina hepatica ATCC 64428]